MDVLSHGCAQRMAKDASWFVVFVEPHIEEGRGVIGPNYRAGYIGHDVGKIDPRLDNAHSRRVELRPGFVGKPCKQSMVGGMTCGTDMEEGLAAREFVTVKQDLLLPFQIHCLHPIRLHRISW